MPAPDPTPRRRGFGHRVLDFLGDAVGEALICGVGIAVVSVTVWGWHEHRRGTIVVWSLVLGLAAFGAWSLRPAARLRREHPLMALGVTVLVIVVFLLLSVVSCSCWWFF